MKTHETATQVRAFDRAYINGQFVTPHGTQVVDLVNPTDNKVIGKVTMADEIDTRKAIGAAKEAFNTFSQSRKEYRMELLQRLHDAVAKRMDQLVEATVVEYGAPQDRAKGSNNLGTQWRLRRHLASRPHRRSERHIAPAQEGGHHVVSTAFASRH
jgi:aldehyde dehydrogenase (NAD+)